MNNRHTLPGHYIRIGEESYLMLKRKQVDALPKQRLSIGQIADKILLGAKNAKT